MAVDKVGRKWLRSVVGDRTSETGDILWKQIKHIAQGARVYTDHWEAYEEILPYENHIRGKIGTCTVEGLNGVFRHMLARLRRKTKCYSKSEVMLRYSLNLLILKRNNLLSILS